MPQRRKPEPSSVKVNLAQSNDTVVNSATIASVDYKGAPGASTRVGLGSGTVSSVTYSAFGPRVLAADDEVEAEQTTNYTITENTLHSGTFSATRGLWGGYSRAPVFFNSPTQSTQLTLEFFMNLSDEGNIVTPDYPLQATTSTFLTTSQSAELPATTRYFASPGPNYDMTYQTDTGGFMGVEPQAYTFNLGTDVMPAYAPTVSFSTEIKTPGGGVPNAQFSTVASGSLRIAYGYFNETGSLYVE
jgi:hypothetical protein